MAWSTEAEQIPFRVAKSHSLGFAVRVEDRLHASIIQAADECWFTVRPANYTLGLNDTDIVPGTNLAAGDGVVSAGTISGTGEETVFLFAVQGSELNLDPELDWWYDITYVRDGYSVSVAHGEFQVSANVTNRGAQEDFVGDGSAFQLIAGMDGQNLINVSASMPMPQDGEAGTGSYVVTAALTEAVGASVEVDVSTISAPGGRPIQVGDVIFSSTTPGILATVQSIVDTTVTIMTRQVFSRSALKALLDVAFHTVPTAGTGLEVIDSTWNINKSSIPLPAGYNYNVGDLVFSHCGISAASANKKLVASIITVVNATTVTVQTKIVFPLVLGADEIDALLATYVPTSRTINGTALTSNVTLSEDNIPAGTTYGKVTPAQTAKLDALPTAASLAASLAAKAALSHTHEMSAINGLSAALATKVESDGSVLKVLKMTQAAYDAITPVSTTIYFIEG